MKKIDESQIILRFEDHEGIIHDVGLDSILEGGIPINLDGGEEMKYLQTFIL